MLTARFSSGLCQYGRFNQRVGFLGSPRMPLLQGFGGTPGAVAPRLARRLPQQVSLRRRCLKEERRWEKAEHDLDSTAGRGRVIAFVPPGCGCHERSRCSREWRRRVTNAKNTSANFSGSGKTPGHTASGSVATRSLQAVLIVQRIERWFPKPLIRVRFPVRTSRCVAGAERCFKRTLTWVMFGFGRQVSPGGLGARGIMIQPGSSTLSRGKPRGGGDSFGGAF